MPLPLAWKSRQGNAVTAGATSTQGRCGWAGGAPVRSELASECRTGYGALQVSNLGGVPHAACELARSGARGSVSDGYGELEPDEREGGDAELRGCRVRPLVTHCAAARSKAGAYLLQSLASMPRDMHNGRQRAVIVAAISRASFRASSVPTSKSGAASIAASTEASYPLSSLIPVWRCVFRSARGLMSKAGESFHAPPPTYRKPWFFRWSSSFETRMENSILRCNSRSSARRSSLPPQVERIVSAKSE